MPTPAKQTTAVAFGGAELNQLFITTAGRSEPAPLIPPGCDPVSGCFGGKLYLGAGKPVAGAVQAELCEIFRQLDEIGRV